MKTYLHLDDPSVGVRQMIGNESLLRSSRKYPATNGKILFLKQNCSIILKRSIFKLILDEEKKQKSPRERRKESIVPNDWLTTNEIDKKPSVIKVNIRTDLTTHTIQHQHVEHLIFSRGICFTIITGRLLFTTQGDCCIEIDQPTPVPHWLDWRGSLTEQDYVVQPLVGGKQETEWPYPYS